MKVYSIIIFSIASGLCSGAAFDRNTPHKFGMRRKHVEVPEEEIEIVKSQDDYDIAEDRVFHAVEDAEKATLHAIENVEKVAVHAIEDEVDTFFHGLKKHHKMPVLESEEKVKKVKHEDEDELTHKRHHYEGPWKDVLEDMMWGSLE